MSALEVHTYTAPSCWASYLINGDASGLDDEDIAKCDAWLESLPSQWCVSCEELGFCHFHDAREFAPCAADCAIYTFHEYT